MDCELRLFSSIPTGNQAIDTMEATKWSIRWNFWLKREP